MVKTLVGALALASIPSALAFQNTSPFFLFSTAELLIPGAGSDIAQYDDVTDRIKNVLKSCPTKSYIVMEQGSVSTDDYRDSHATPRLSHYLSGNEGRVRSTLIVPEVIAKPGAESPAMALSEYIKKQCGADTNVVVDVNMGSRDSAGHTLANSDATPSLDAKLEDYIVDQANSDDYTVIFTTTPPTSHKSSSASNPTYEMESPFNDAVQMELKRDLGSHRRAAAKQEGALFERYQYFSPGIFMAFLAIIPMFSIIFVGLRALTSLEVSYFAFSKEMGPTAQRKQ